MNDIELLTGIPLSSNKALNDVVIYSNSNYNGNLKGNLKENTFQHVDVGNVSAPEALFSSTGASHPGVKKDQEKTGRGYRRLSTEDLYVEINVQINHIRTEGRYNRVNVYVSLKEEQDSRYSIFLSGAATNCMTELRRGAKEDKTVLDVIDTFYNERPGSLIGRLHYKAPRGIKTSNFHRKLLRHAIINIYDNEGEAQCELYLLGEWYPIPMNSELTEKQKELYCSAGIYRRDMDQFDENEELE